MDDASPISYFTSMITPSALIARLFNDPLWVTLASAAFSLIVLGMALFAQYHDGAHPCPLCIYQRWPYALIAGLGILALLRPGLIRWILAAVTLAFLGNAGIALYHTGIEQYWWASGTCGGLNVAGSVDDVLARIQSAPVTRCDEVTWRFLGLSMANWNVIICAVATLICGRALLRPLRRK